MASQNPAALTMELLILLPSPVALSPVFSATLKFSISFDLFYFIFLHMLRLPLKLFAYTGTHKITTLFDMYVIKKKSESNCLITGINHFLLLSLTGLFLTYTMYVVSNKLCSTFMFTHQNPHISSL